MPEPDDKNKGGEGGVTLETIQAKLKEIGFDNLDSLVSDRGRILQERESLKTQIENATKKINEQGQELGTLRKEVTTLKESKGKGGTPAGDEHGQPVEIDEAKLTPEQKKAIDDHYAKLDEEQKLWVAQSKENRSAFIRTVFPAVRVVPKSLFEEPTQDGSSPLDGIRQKLGIVIKDQTQLPVMPAKKAGSMNNNSRDGKPQTTTRVPDGDVLGSLSRSRAQTGK